MMKKTYIKPEFENNAIALEVSIMGLSGIDENGNTIIDDGGNGDGSEGDANKSSLWDENVNEDYL